MGRIRRAVVGVVQPQGGKHTVKTQFVRNIVSTTSLLALLTACGPAVDPPPLVLRECRADNSPTELARFDYDPEVDFFQPFDLGQAVTVGLDLGDDESKHYIVDNCGGTPLRLRGTFDSVAPGTARVGDDIVLCPGGEGFPGVHELLEDGSAGEDLGLGLLCAHGWLTYGVRNAASAYGFMWTESGVTQYLPDGTARALPFFGQFSRVNNTWLLIGDDGEVGMFGPDGADPVVLDLPEAIVYVHPPADSSPWIILLPDAKGRDYTQLYMLDTTDGSWFVTPPTSDGFSPHKVPVRAGLAITQFPVDVTIDFTRAGWDASLNTDLDRDAGFTVIDEEHVLIVNDRDVRLLRVPLEFPGESEASYEVLWKYPVPNGESLAHSFPGMLWQDIVLLPFLAETWAFPTDGSEPYPFLPGHLDAIYFGSDFITAIEQATDSGNDARLVRRALGGELEVLAEGLLDFEHRPWTPELGRILYAVRDGDEVSIRQHRLTD